MKITKTQLRQIVNEETEVLFEEISYVPQLMDDVATDIGNVLRKPEYAKLDFANFEIADQIAKALEQVARDIRDNARTRS